jgi:hypothetical protein
MSFKRLLPVRFAARQSSVSQYADAASATGAGGRRERLPRRRSFACKTRFQRWPENCNEIFGGKTPWSTVSRASGESQKRWTTKPPHLINPASLTTRLRRRHRPFQVKEWPARVRMI